MKKLNELDRRGFTLIEVIVVAAIIAILAGILVPMIFNQIDESKISKAKGDAKTIQTAIMMFRKDNSSWPNRTAGANPASNTIQVLFSEGTPIVDLATKGWNGSSAQLIDPLKVNDTGYPAATWKGPYLTAADADPWGNRYMVSAKNFETSGPVWVLSAGPDGIIQTGVDDAVISGDDIGILVK